ncbi:hypothetical protein [Gloeocapsopsis dulcis]|uniref:Surface-adhesin protein E-like domain-containing protein n=1 Tax=Gloeocapsopsis dulcis AAB1 = 1H9 TaxID=1433147 RepID=A0A6N8FPT1_9CHRO|nr:hypothetical protein [Gloeocapsopsis dulcis]MUL35263.1 hypothetical protein [Gloeocapsopsis dulcis AAB1 = 1H9]WNN89144.1 hypothetical protein P0S91_23320 [Gloeocapsopsis dulcis]
MLKKIIVATTSLVALLYTNSVLARQWVMISPEPYLAVDVDSIKGTGDARTFWSEFIDAQEPNRSYISFNSSKPGSILSLTYVNCASNKRGVLRQVEYNSNGKLLRDYDLSHLAIPPSLRSPVPESIGEAELLYICSLRTANGARQSITGSRTISSSIITRNTSFPRKSCGDSFQRQGTYWPVFIDGGNLSNIRTNLCNDAFSIIRERGIRSVQLASFTSYERASSFAKQVGGTVGQATHYINGRIVN